MNLGGAQMSMTVAEVAEREGVEVGCGGVSVTVEPVAPESSDPQQRGWHWLLHQWLLIDPEIAANLEALKSRLLILMWGCCRVSDRHGNETLIPLRRTTQQWSWDVVPPRYVKKKLTRQLYTELVEFTYQKAAEDGTVLPDMDPRFKEAAA